MFQTFDQEKEKPNQLNYKTTNERRQKLQRILSRHYYLYF